MTKWLKTVGADIVFNADHNAACYEMDGGRKWPRWVWLIYGAFDLLRDRTRRIQCVVLGHDWQTESHAGPESGVDEIYCARCGEFHRIIHY